MTTQVDARLIKNSPQRLDYIDGLRGIAILSVIFYHIWMACGYPFWHWWNPIAHGYVGVDLFLMLSGFCLYWPIIGQKKSFTLRQFAKRRARRILPPYYIALGLFAAMDLLWPHRFGDALSVASATKVLQTIVWHILMLHNLNPDQLWSINSPFWSLALEVDLYISLPILVILARRYGISRAVIIAAVVTVVYRITLDRCLGGNAAWESVGSNYAYTLCYSLPGKWLEFALGMLLAHLVTQDRQNGLRLLSPAISTILLIFGAYWSEKRGQFDPLVDLSYASGLFGIILYCAQQQVIGKSTSFWKITRSPGLVWLGKISFSMYLIHLPLLIASYSLLHLNHQRVSIQFAVSVFILLPTLVGIGYLFHMLCERPFMNNPRILSRQSTNLSEAVVRVTEAAG